MKTYKAYPFRSQDPAVSDLFDEIGTATDSEVEKNGGPARGTVRNWRNKKTKRPLNATLEAAGRAMGIRRVWVPLKGKNSSG